MMRKKKLGEKGISPLIATVLIIGFTVALGVSIIVWGVSFSKKTMEVSEKVAYKKMSCYSDVSFTVKSSCLGGSEVLGRKLNFLISNDGVKAIDSFLLTFSGSSGADRKTVSINLDPYGVKTLSSQYSHSGVGSLKKVELSPFIKFDGELVLCSDNVYSIENFDMCELSEFQVEACKTADKEDTCDTKLKKLGLVTKEECCLKLKLCC